MGQLVDTSLCVAYILYILLKPFKLNICYNFSEWKIKPLTAAGQYIRFHCKRARISADAATVYSLHSVARRLIQPHECIHSINVTLSFQSIPQTVIYINALYRANHMLHLTQLFVFQMVDSFDDDCSSDSLLAVCEHPLSLCIPSLRERERYFQV